MQPSEKDLLDFEDKKIGLHSDSEVNLIRRNTSLNESNNTKLHFKRVLEDNPLGSDLVLCLFITALESYRADTCLRPFPPVFINNNKEKDFNSLQKACQNISSVKDLVTKNDENLKSAVPLLNWLFVERQYPKLLPCSPREVEFVYKSNKDALIPQYVFKVCQSEKIEALWKNRIEGKEIIHAFHGSTVNNFFSIVNFGLQQHFSDGKAVLYGNGIYLSSELAVCMNFAPFSETWQKSNLGKKLSIIALCDIINHPEKVKCKDSNYTRREQIPEKYFIVTDNDLVRVKYLLVYRLNTPSVVGSFIKKNAFWIILFLYFLLLVSIGLFK